MTNAKKYLRDGVSVEEFKNAFGNYYINSPQFDDGIDAVESFLEQAIPPTLTEDERVILRNIDKRYKYLYRNNKGQLRITDFSYKEQPEKCGWDIFWGFDHLFQFIKERRRI